MMGWYGNGGYDGGFGGWGYLVMMIGPLLFLGLLIVGIFYLVRGASGQGQQQAPPASSSAAETLLATRYARGDIDEAEYLSRLQTLRSHTPT